LYSLIPVLVQQFNVDVFAKDDQGMTAGLYKRCLLSGVLSINVLSIQPHR